jgi:hypothetical protein
VSVTSSGITSETSRRILSHAIRCERFVLTAESHVASCPVIEGGGTIGVIGTARFTGFGCGRWRSESCPSSRRAAVSRFSAAAAFVCAV